MTEDTNQDKQRYLFSMLKPVLVFCGGWLAIIVISLVLRIALEKYGILVILIPAGIALLHYHKLIKDELQSLKDEVQHLRNIDSWPKEERQYFLQRLQE